MAVLEGKFHEGDRILVTPGPDGTLEFERAEPAVAGAGVGAGAAGGGAS